MSKLNFDFFVWPDADTIFLRNPLDILASLGCAPMHVPLEVNLSAMAEDREWRGRSCFGLRDLFRQAGIVNAAYLSQSAFWIVHRDVIEEVYELAMQFLNQAKAAGLAVNVDEALGYAMQILCADPEAHLLAEHAELWASDDEGLFRGALPNGGSWQWRHPLNPESTSARPAIIHLPHSRDFLAKPAE